MKTVTRAEKRGLPEIFAIIFFLFVLIAADMGVFLHRHLIQNRTKEETWQNAMFTVLKNSRKK